MSQTPPVLPAGSCDAHMHLYRRGAAPAGAPFTAPDATVEGYREVMARLGIGRVVLVQSMLYGIDNSALLEGLAALGPQIARGIAVTRADAPRSLWDELAGRGVCGLRAFMLPGGFLSWEELRGLGARLADRGWQMHLQMDGREIARREALLSQLPCPLVLDHVGKFIEPVALEHPSFRALLRLVDRGRLWVKLSGLYETSRSGPPEYADVTMLARRLASVAPERMLWASNWPHPNLQPPPDDAELASLAGELMPDAESRRRLFVENAAELFGFAEEGFVQ